MRCSNTLWRSIVALKLTVLFTCCGSSSSHRCWAAPPFVEDVLHHFSKRHGERPATREDRTIEQLAQHIDWLEHELDRWGTVVAKAPDVWGEARLTQYRHEVEGELAEELDGFAKGQLNAAQAVSDQAFLAAAFSLKFQPQGPSAGVTPTEPVIVVNETKTADKAPDSKTIVINAQQAAPLFGIEAEKLKIGSGLVLEQTEELDQLKRYLDHLNELRRTNEGDDSADAPGYSLNLVRIPVSILPGTRTDEGYGAEITVSARPEFGPELLPTSYREFVINDLVDQLAIPLTRFLNDEPSKARQVIDAFGKYERAEESFDTFLHQAELNPCLLAPDPQVWQIVLNHCQNSLDFQLISLQGCLQSNAFDPQNRKRLLAELEVVWKAYDEYTRNGHGIHSGAPARVLSTAESPMVPAASAVRLSVKQLSDKMSASRSQEFEHLPEQSPEAAATLAAGPADNERAIRLLQLTGQLEELTALLEGPTQLTELTRNLTAIVPTIQVPNSSSRRSTLPYPPSQLESVFHLHNLGHIAQSAFATFRQDVVNRQIVHLTDVQAYLRAEISAAYDLLTVPESAEIWTLHGCDGSLVSAIRRNDVESIDATREQFLGLLGTQNSHRLTSILAWGVYVESLLLNERLIEDMRQTAGPYGESLNPPAGLTFYGPTPSEEARKWYADYVAARWPLKVFTVDPINNEQNVADISSVYRQMQLAVTLSVAGGDVGAGTALRYLREIQRDMATVDLNRTIVGFTHGDDTFGWRFFPRFQTPPVEGNLTTIARDLIVGGPTDKQLERSKRLEPGMRECLALVLMPSFVQKISLDVRSNWFKLTRPGHTALSVAEAMEYSRSVTQMRENAEQCVRRPELYRPGETDRLIARIRQLENELPLQTLHCVVPTENTLGGFEVFASGTRELAPELLGWYGAPGYDPRLGATLFLAGDNFSVHQTSVIAGTRALPVERMLSRQVIQVTLPPGLPILRDERLPEVAPHDYLGYVDIHVGTPYGVSTHLLVPAVKPDPDAANAIHWRNGVIRMQGQVQVRRQADSPATPPQYSLENLAWLPFGPVEIQCPRLPWTQNQASVTLMLGEQTPAGTVVVAKDTTAKSAQLNQSTGVITLGDQHLESVRTQLETLLKARVSAQQISRQRFMFILGGSVSVNMGFSDEIVQGGVPVEVVLTPQ